MPRGLLSDRGELLSLFDELAEELERHEISVDIVMVGGAWMLWHAQRVATRDVDSARRLDARAAEAIEIVASRHELSSRWVNDSAAGFWPADRALDDCDVVYRRRALLVRAPHPDVVFVMKLYRASPQDREDMVTLWPMCSFVSATNAVESFRRGYPHADHDEHLVDFVRDIARDADVATPHD